MNIHRNLLIAIATLLLTHSALAVSVNEMELPDAPEGYRWERFTEVQSAFLCPTNWFRFQKPGTSAHTYTLSQESVAEQGSYETGMALQVIKGLQAKKGMPPSVFAIEMAQATLGKRENRKLFVKDLSSGPFKAFGVRYRNAPDVASPIIIHQVMIANDKQDTLFIVTFEAPEKSWDVAWQHGDRMLKMFLIDDAY